MSVRRLAISNDLKVRVWRRDGWICHWCGRPVIFSQVMPLLEKIVRDSGFDGPLAYWHTNWSRKNAPLLDYLGANVDHVEAHSKGGAHGVENFVTACNKCNMRKNDANADDFGKRVPRHHVKGKYGEPTDWDGFSTLFIVLVERDPKAASSSELAWLRALTVAKTAAVVEAAPITSAPKPKPVAKVSAKSKFQFVGVKNSNGVVCPDPGGWGSFERPYSSLASLLNDSRVYNRTIHKYREITLGVPGEWVIVTPDTPFVKVET